MSNKLNSATKRLVTGATICIATAASPAFAQQYTLTTLTSFNGSDGAGPDMTLNLSDDGITLYGSTKGGGTYSDGVVFSLPITGGTPTVLASFDGYLNPAPAGEGDGVGVNLSGSTLYGTTWGGGAYRNGEVFLLPTTGGTPTVLASFKGTNGDAAIGPLLLSGSTLYGMTEFGGAHGDGEVFSVPSSGGTPTILASFNGNGSYPMAGLTFSNDGSTLYGTTYYGGAHGDGEVFSVPVSGGTPTVLVSFNGTNGLLRPAAGLILSGNTLYGTTSYDVFSLPVTGGTPTVLASLSESAETIGPLLLSGSTLYGTTEFGGVNGDGEVFSVPVTGGTPMLLASFNGTNGEYPFGNLVTDGHFLYSTTLKGGANGDGTVFSLTLPEPGSLALLAVGGLGLLVRRRRRSSAEIAEDDPQISRLD